MAGMTRQRLSPDSRKSRLFCPPHKKIERLTGPSVSEQTEQDKLMELAHQLEGPMQARSEILKQCLAHTIAPAARKVKSVHSVLEEKFDVTFG